MLTLNYNDELTFFTTELAVIVSHLNYGNHLGYDAMLSIMQEARIRWLKLHDFNEASLGTTVGYIVRDVSVVYKGEAFHGDMLGVSLYIDEVDKRSFRIHYSVQNESSGKTIAVAETGHVFFDYSQRKIASAPDPFLSVLSVSNNKPADV